MLIDILDDLNRACELDEIEDVFHIYYDYRSETQLLSSHRRRPCL